jgi:uncharacterized protein YkwD
MKPREAALAARLVTVRGSTPVVPRSIATVVSAPERDWYRQPDTPPPAPPKRSRFSAPLILALLFTVLLAVIGMKWMSFSEQSMSSGEQQSRPGDIKFSILPGLPELTIRKGSLYPEHDPWKSYLASEATCPGGERTDLPLDQQADVMVCLVDYAREQRGLSALTPVALLNQSSLKKADKIIRCNEFSHDACGEDAANDARAAGYSGEWGENLYLGEGRLGAPRVALDGWLNSPGHRENLFRPEWRIEGIAVMRAAQVGDFSNALVWVNQFGTS